ncbi:rab-3A-interacting protein isoform X4 [Maylandia zebra]|uniref:Rab-3A-interacting protein isoform X3 n=2 Tax=Haplochromini TaxID=319058 RepID=A0A9Y3RVM3_9CICH|nr:PREDICTED: rab-3A-interacting protein isoform X3 [Pundamilia nyererei]XP_012778820.1 rab-3A-interacting protein isoform X4 [Maylandia zebra]XP_026002352.1 rab-3A-interacting protein isoform X4 [Astatotilapia calliptera]
MACSSGQNNAETLEGFHEVNLASPTTPDLQNQSDQRPAIRHTTPPTSLYRTHSLGAPPPGLPTSLRADQLPTQPVYSAPRHSHNGSVPGLEAESAEFMSGEDGEECGALSDSLSRLRSPSVMEVREKGYERLKEELAKAQREAHKMVREANVKQANAEKQLKEALGKIDVLQAEVQALKTLVLSSPTSPVGELPSVGTGGGVKTPFRKGHSRNKSTSSAMLGTQPDPSATQPIVRECREVDGQLFSEFKAWKEEPTFDRSCSFLERIYREDIYPCLTFNKSELGSAILEAVEQNTLSVEPVGFQPLPVVKASAVECGGPNGRRSELVTKCALSGQTKTCKHRIKFGDSSSYYYVSPYCRYRITAVCNFFTYIRYIHQGLVKQQDAEQMFWEVMQLRREMSLAKLGYYKDQL